jgi:hypothetical protein
MIRKRVYIKFWLYYSTSLRYLSTVRRIIENSRSASGIGYLEDIVMLGLVGWIWGGVRCWLGSSQVGSQCYFVASYPWCDL